MFLRQTSSGHLVEILDTRRLADPCQGAVMARAQYGEELPDPEEISKNDLEFPSGEALPRCWRDVHYRDDEIKPRH